jgi:hypothetical protein
MRHLSPRTAGLVTTALLGGALFGACNDGDPVSSQLANGLLAASRSQSGGPRPALGDYSVTPALVKLYDANARAYAILGSDDVLPGSPNFIFGGSADGTGLLRNPDGTFTMLVNHEDNFSVSRISLDASLRPTKGEYLLNSTAGRFRLCSATLATPNEHGFGPLFITAGESNQESQIHAVDPFGGFNETTLLTAFGRWNTENAVPLPRTAYNGRTVVLIGDDDSGPYGGQLAMYVSDVVGDLQHGRLFAMARVDGNVIERDMVVGERYAVEFREVPEAASRTGAQINAITGEMKAIQFGRVEDIDYRKGAQGGREIYFNVTGQDDSGVNAGYTRSKYGRVYRLTLAPNDPTRGTLEVILDGDDRGGPARAFQNPDNILVTRNFVYIQEDPNGYGDEAHDSYIYQYDIAARTLKVVMELDHRRDDPYYGGDSRHGAWEYGAMLDVTDRLGGTGDDGTFLIAVQPHTWRGDKYRNPDGGAVRPNENQASQMIVVTGLRR